MSERGAVEDPLAGWDPRRRASLERLWQRFHEAAGDVRLSDELLAERRQENSAAGRAGPRGEVGVDRRPGSRPTDGGLSGE